MIRSLVVLTLLLLIACARAAPAAAPPAGPTPSPVPPTPTPVFPQPPPPAQGQDQVRGIVQSLGEGRLILADGKSITLTPETRFIRAAVKSKNELQKGSFVGITAAPQADGTLLASAAGIFPAGSTVPPGQRPDWADTLMSNATVEAVEGDVLTVSWDAGSGRVRLKPDVQVFQRENATIDNVRAGMPVTVVTGANGNAVSVSVN